MSSRPRTRSVVRDIPRAEARPALEGRVVRPAGTGEAREGRRLRIERRFTTPGVDPLESVEYARRTSRITNTDGSVVFEMEDVEVPSGWSQVATDVIASKYFRKAGVPQVDAQGRPLVGEDNKPVLGPERSAKQVVRRLAGCWRFWAEQHGYFDTPQDAQAFEDELKFMLIHQMAAPNSPQWFNTGIHFAYGITGPAQGHFYCDPKTGEVRESPDAYTHPQPHACFIQSVEDDMVNPGGIMDLWVREARLFKYGSGTGTNFSAIRGEDEPLSHGGKSSGLMSFLRIGDRAAGAIKSGGTTRRAAKMVCLDLDHPDIEKFITWKVREEKKVVAMVEAGYECDFNGEAYQTVSGQNSNNSVRVPHEFFEALERDGDWSLTFRTELLKAKEEGRAAVPCKVLKARDLWDQIGMSAWSCADPGVQYDTTINDWHTCPADGRIRASNPCSEYMFLDNTACNLASINLLHFYGSTQLTTGGSTDSISSPQASSPQDRGNGAVGSFNIEAYKHAIRLWTVVLEISVLMAQFPSREIARLSYMFRTLGLGYANMGALLMRMGITYDSALGRSIAGALTAILTGESYATSAEMARVLGPFPGYARNREEMLRVMRNHRRAAYDAPVGEYEGLHVPPVGIDQSVCPRELLEVAKECWDRALSMGETTGYRNAQTTVIAPTGTIGLVMDCDTTGIEPDFALVKFKKLAGGGYWKIANQSMGAALTRLGYREDQVKEILQYVLGTMHLSGVPHINRMSLRAKGFTDEDIAKVEQQLPSVFELAFAFSRWTLGDALLQRLGFRQEQICDPHFNLLASLGFSPEQIEEADQIVCGRMTVEGAPHLRPEHLPVFDCANKCGKIGKRFIAPEAHIRMMASAQPFVSGAISKTINLPHEATVEDIKACYLLSWKLGLKANALYRDGSKMSQPLSNKSEKTKSKGWDGGSVVEKIVEKIVVKEVPRRRKLPAERRSITHKFSIAGHEGYLTVGLYDDGVPGELFIKMAKEGSTLSGVMDAFALSLSLALQYGAPLEVFVRKFVHSRFDPAGMTGNPEIPMAKSIIDYIGRWMALKFLSKDKAKEVHNAELVELAYREGTKSHDAFAATLLVIDEGNGHTAAAVVKAPLSFAPAKGTPLAFQGTEDAPVCSDCGSVMIRNGACYKCLDCGNTSGCS